MAPKMFLTTVLKRLGLLALIYVASKKVVFGSLGYPVATSLSGSTRDFLKLSFDMLPYNEILKVFKSKI